MTMLPSTYQAPKDRTTCSSEQHQDKTIRSKSVIKQLTGGEEEGKLHKRRTTETPRDGRGRR